MSSKPANQKRSMFVYGDIPQQCPVVGPYEEQAGEVQCPFMHLWERPMDKTCGYSARPEQCLNNYYVRSNVQYLQQQQYRQSEVQAPIIPNLPCHQAPQWDYNSMCFNVNGQPCQYTNVVDLEDFMNNEKRKEKSRVAARCRRTKEMQIFTELTEALPARKEEVEQLDKASVMRLAISFLRVRDVVSMLPQDAKEAPQIQNPKGLEEVSSELSYMKALDGFVLVFSQQGDIVYCSENIADHLGVSQMEIMGQSVFEFSHPCDHDEIREALRSSGGGRRELLLRLKCTLTSKGRNVHLKSASYKVIHVTGHMLTPASDKDKAQEHNDSDEEKTKTASLVAVGRPIPHPSNIEIPLDSKTFLSKHSLDMKFTYTDEALLNTLGFEPEELVGRSLYDFHHAGDSAALVQQFKSLFSKGQCETGQYRFLAKDGGYAWVQTQATVITDKQQKPVSIVCVNYVISGIECKDEVFAAHQVVHAELKPAKASATAHAPPVCADLPNGAIVAAVPPEDERPIPVTELIFAPREKEMNKGFLMFSHEDEGLTMLKDEPEDLTHLAPTAGDACIPLENSPFELFDDFILNDNYCSLLGDDLTNGSPVDSLTADSLLMSSPEPQENDSSLTELSLDAFESGRSDKDIDDGHSPFIPTSDELPLLEPAVMWGALPDSVSLARPQPPEQQNASPAPALQRLLAAPPTGPPPQDLITNIYSDQGLIPSRSISTWDTGVKRVLKQEEEPSAKRAKRSPSPVQPQITSPSSQRSSVLMNLLHIQQQQQQQQRQQQQMQLQFQQKVQPPPQEYKLPVNYQLLITAPNCIQQKSINPTLPIPVINAIQTSPNKKIIRTVSPNITQYPQQMRTNINMSAMSPLSLNIGSPMYSLPASPITPNYSPAISPAPKDRVLSPYSTPQSMSPIGQYRSPTARSPAGIIQGSDPYLSTKMQPSPNFPLQATYQIQEFLDHSVQLATPDWMDSEMLQDASELLTALDVVKLV